MAGRRGVSTFAVQLEDKRYSIKKLPLSRIGGCWKEKRERERKRREEIEREGRWRNVPAAIFLDKRTKRNGGWMAAAVAGISLLWEATMGEKGQGAAAGVARG
jgi:hypothetical protein